MKPGALGSHPHPPAAPGHSEMSLCCTSRSLLTGESQVSGTRPSGPTPCPVLSQSTEVSSWLRKGPWDCVAHPIQAVTAALKALDNVPRSSGPAVEASEREMNEAQGCSRHLRRELRSLLPAAWSTVSVRYSFTEQTAYF